MGAVVNLRKVIDNSEPSKDVWVVSNGWGRPEYVCTSCEDANNYATQSGDVYPEDGPYRVRKYSYIPNK